MLNNTVFFVIQKNETMTLENVKQKIDHSKDLDFSILFNECIELWKKIWVEGLLLFVIATVSIIPLAIIVTMPMAALTPLENGIRQPVDYIIVFSVIIIIVLFLFFYIAFLFALKSGFYKLVKYRDLNIKEPINLFVYCNKKYFKKSIQLSLITFGISFIAILLCYLPFFYVIIPMYYINVIFAMQPELSNKEIIETGFYLGTKKWLLSFGLTFVIQILAQFAGFVMCGIGIFVTASAVFLPVYLIYKKTIGFDIDNSFKIESNILLENN